MLPLKRIKEIKEKAKQTKEEMRKCLFCKDQKQQIKECCEKANVKNNPFSVQKHIIGCSDCRTHIMMIAECKKNGHKEK